MPSARCGQLSLSWRYLDDAEKILASPEPENRWVPLILVINSSQRGSGSIGRQWADEGEITAQGE